MAELLGIGAEGTFLISLNLVGDVRMMVKRDVTTNTARVTEITITRFLCSNFFNCLFLANFR